MILWCTYLNKIVQKEDLYIRSEVDIKDEENTLR